MNRLKLLKLGTETAASSVVDSLADSISFRPPTTLPTSGRLATVAAAAVLMEYAAVGIERYFAYRAG